MINFPKPLDLFQQKLWRLYWVEWIVIMFIMSINDHTLSGFEHITFPVVGGLIMTFTSKCFAIFFVGLYKAITIFPG